MKPPAYFVDSMALVGFRFTKCVSVATQPSRPLTNLLMLSTCRLRLLFICCMVLVPAQSLLGTLVNSSTPGVRHEIDGIASTFTTSADMVGLEIMVYFEDGSTDLGIWAGNGVSQNDWSFTLPPNSTSFSVPFSLTNNTGLDITRFALHGAGSDTFFDRDIAPDTPGTFRGRDVIEFTSLQFSQDIDAVFFDEIAVVGSSPQADTFAGLDISFSEGITANGGVFEFLVDTDTSVNLVTSTIPEPTSAIQFGIALTLLMTRRRRRVT